MQETYIYTSDIQEIPRIRLDIQNLYKLWQVPDAELRQVIVIVEELFSNIIRFAFEDHIEHEININLERDQQDLKITLIDDGTSFNPMQYNPSEVSDPVISETGGMGLTLVETFSDSIDYHRIGNKNHLTVSKTIKSKP